MIIEIVAAAIPTVAAIAISIILIRRDK